MHQLEGVMSDKSILGLWIKRFLLEYLPSEKNLARNTQQSYRDTIRLLILFLAAAVHKHVEDLRTTDLSADQLKDFLTHVEQTRKCSIATRNQRLAASHALGKRLVNRSSQFAPQPA